MLPHCGLMIPEKLWREKTRWLKELGGVFVGDRLLPFNLRFVANCFYLPSPPSLSPSVGVSPSSTSLDTIDPFSSTRKWRICEKVAVDQSLVASGNLPGRGEYLPLAECMEGVLEEGKRMGEQWGYGDRASQ